MKERSEAYLNLLLLYPIVSMKMSFMPLDSILQSHIQRTNTFQKIKQFYKLVIPSLINMNCIQLLKTIKYKT